MSTSTTEPVEVISGDTLEWTKSLADYPAGTWTLSYYLRATSGTSYAVTAGDITASGTDFAVVIPASETTGWAAGTYRLFGFVTYSSKRHKVYEGEIVVTANQATSSGATDSRTHAQKMLALIEANLEGTASREEQSYAIETPGGTRRQIQFFSREELIKLYQFYKRLREDEIAAENVAAGRASGRRVLTRFV